MSAWKVVFPSFQAAATYPSFQAAIMYKRDRQNAKDLTRHINLNQFFGFSIGFIALTIALVGVAATVQRQILGRHTEPTIVVWGILFAWFNAFVFFMYVKIFLPAARKAKEEREDG